MPSQHFHVSDSFSSCSFNWLDLGHKTKLLCGKKPLHMIFSQRCHLTWLSFSDTDRYVSYTWVSETSGGYLRSIIDLSQPRHETAFWWRHNGPVTSQLTDPIKWPNYPLELIGIYVHINTRNKESLTQQCHRSTNVQPCSIFLYIYVYILSLNGWYVLFCMKNNRHDITITTHAIKRHFLIGWRRWNNLRNTYVLVF